VYLLLVFVSDFFQSRKSRLNLSFHRFSLFFSLFSMQTSARRSRSKSPMRASSKRERSRSRSRSPEQHPEGVFVPPSLFFFFGLTPFSSGWYLSPLNFLTEQQLERRGKESLRAYVKRIEALLLLAKKKGYRGPTFLKYNMVVDNT
jgi:hypothetical protein